TQFSRSLISLDYSARHTEFACPGHIVGCIRFYPLDTCFRDGLCATLATSKSRGKSHETSGSIPPRFHLERADHREPGACPPGCRSSDGLGGGQGLFRRGYFRSQGKG